MPRRRKITLRASELECFETLVRELQQRPEFAGFDPSSLHAWATPSDPNAPSSDDIPSSGNAPPPHRFCMKNCTDFPEKPLSLLEIFFSNYLWQP